MGGQIAPKSPPASPTSSALALPAVGDDDVLAPHHRTKAPSSHRMGVDDARVLIATDPVVIVPSLPSLPLLR